jgi:hypothetical protein
VADHVIEIKELDVEAMVAEMRPPTDDDVPIALDGTRLDSAEKVRSYLEAIDVRRVAAQSGG